MARVSLLEPLSLAAACLHHLGEDTFINNENRTDTEITRTEEEGRGWSQHGASYSEEILALSDCGSCNPLGLSAEGAERIPGSCFQ